MKYVYLIKSIDNNNYKIGTSKDPKKRLKMLQTGNSFNLILIKEFYSKYPFKLEMYLHSIYSHLNAKGEWFKYNSDIEINFINNCKIFEKNQDFIKINSINNMNIN